MAISPSIVREHIETGLTDTAIQRLIDDATSYAEEIAGPETGEDTVHRHGGAFSMKLRRRADAINSITDLEASSTLDSTTYQLIFGGLMVQRTSLEGFPYKWQFYEIKYNVIADTAIRNRVLLDLVELAIESESGIKSISDGSFSATQVENVTRERYRIVSQLLPKASMIV